MSGKPDNWQFDNRDIKIKLNIKRAEMIANYWKELINSSWIMQITCDTSGNLTGMLIIICKTCDYGRDSYNFSPKQYEIEINAC